jgi:nitroimidazol reductase NimA-like FMN-containing flavoprotein (pyridoxamine 5'-phosphate oxidase superfamily)
LSIRLSRDEIWTFLAASHTGIFTSLRRDGTPISLPVWFVTLDEHVYIQTRRHRKKVARIQRNSRVAFLVEAGQNWAELMGTHLTGKAQIVEDPDLNARIQDLFYLKYKGFSTDLTAMPPETRAIYETGGVVIEIVPDERILSWDNGRIRLLG